jgi:uncharacterized phage protein (TIGR02218 family)
MIGASAGLAAHIQLRVTTLAYLWLITRTDAEVFGFTSHDKDISLSGVTYLAAYGITPSALQAGAGLAVGNAEVQTVFYADGMTQDDLSAGVWDHADVRVRIVNWADTSQGVLKELRGWLGEVRHDGFRFTAELRGLADLWNRQRGSTVSPACDAEFCDDRCGLDVADYTTAGEVTAVASLRQFTGDVTGATANTYRAGKIIWLTGNNAGRSMEIKSDDGAGVVQLQLPMVGAIQIGDTFEAVIGCPKTKEFCQAQSNYVNFRGSPFVPGTDRAVKVGGQ